MSKEELSLYCDLLYSELERNKQHVVLVPAPEQKHADHMIRVADGFAPEWYADLYYSTYRVSRDRVFKALDRLKAGIKPKSMLDHNLFEIVEEYKNGKYYPC